MLGEKLHHIKKYSNCNAILFSHGIGSFLKLLQSLLNSRLFFFIKVYRNFLLPWLQESRALVNENCRILKNLSTELWETVTKPGIMWPIVFHKGQVKGTAHHLHVGKCFLLHYDLLFQIAFAQLSSFSYIILQTVQSMWYKPAKLTSNIAQLDLLLFWSWIPELKGLLKFKVLSTFLKGKLKVYIKFSKNYV